MAPRTKRTTKLSFFKSSCAARFSEEKKLRQPPVQTRRFPNQLPPSAGYQFSSSNRNLHPRIQCFEVLRWRMVAIEATWVWTVFWCRSRRIHEFYILRRRKATWDLTLNWQRVYDYFFLAYRFYYCRLRRLTQQNGVEVARAMPDSKIDAG